MATQGGVVNNRREILVALGAGALALAAPPGAFSQQQGKVGRIVTIAQSLLLRADDVIQ
jgi:hypothetical protein